MDEHFYLCRIIRRHIWIILKAQFIVDMDKTKKEQLLFKARKGGKLKILLSKKPIPGQDFLPPKAGQSGFMLGEEDNDDFLIPQFSAQPGLVNFYDLSQVVLEEGISDLDFILVPEIAGYDSGQSDRMIFEEFGSTEWALLKDKLFEIEIDEWENHYKKLDYDSAGVYGIDFRVGDVFVPIAKQNERPLLFDIIDEIDPPNSQSDLWTETGLSVTGPVTRINIVSFNAFYSFDTDDTEAVKVTEEPSFSADTVSMNLGNEFNVFLVPSITMQFLYAEINGSPYQHYSMNFFYTFLSRNLLFNSGIERLLIDRAVWSSGPETIPIGSSEASDVLNHFSGLDDARCFYLNLGDNTEPRDTLPVGSFPSSNEEGWYINCIPETNYTGANDYAQSKVLDINGILLAVVKGPDKTYYIWRNGGTGLTLNDFNNLRVKFD